MCVQHGLIQIVKELTRDKDLHDLVFASATEKKMTKVIPKIGDHSGVLVEVRCEALRETICSRVVWDYGQARWSEPQSALAATDWPLILGDDADGTALYESYRCDGAALHPHEHALRA